MAPLPDRQRQFRLRRPAQTVAARRRKPASRTRYLRQAVETNRIVALPRWETPKKFFPEWQCRQRAVSLRASSATRRPWARAMVSSFRWTARAVAPGERAGAVRTAARDLLHVQQARFAVGHAHDDHAVVQQRGVELVMVVSCPPCCVAVEVKTLPILSISAPAAPQPSGLVEEVAHLRAHVPKNAWACRK